MKIGYGSEKLHHAIHPLFLNLLPKATWEVGEDRQEFLWYFWEEESTYRVRHQSKQWGLPKDMYTLKKHCYDYYEREYGITLPWGIISGIRPTKLARSIWQERPEMVFEEFKNEIWQKVRVSERKAGMLWEVLQTENRYLEKASTPEEKLPLHLYIGIPYCPSRCYYCSFASVVLKGNETDRLEDYLELLEREMELLSELWSCRRIRSIYLGGGTPTVLNGEQLERLLQRLHHYINMAEVEEFTVEAGRPDTITEEKLEILKRFGVGRISINPQTFSNQTLTRIGRHHSVEEVISTFAMAKKQGFIINMDLIFGLKGETKEHIYHSFAEIKNLRPDNITVHTLTAKRSADLSAEDRAQMDSVGRNIGELLDYWYERMREEQYTPYYLYRQKNIYFENVGYSLPGKECIYNMETMLERESILAIGAGSISKKVEEKKITRFEMPKEIEAYRKNIVSKCTEKLELFRV